MFPFDVFPSYATNRRLLKIVKKGITRREKTIRENKTIVLFFLISKQVGRAGQVGLDYATTAELEICRFFHRTLQHEQGVFAVHVTQR